MAQPEISEPPFRDCRHYLLARYGRVLYRVPLDLGFGCPHRQADGTGGCAFCGPGSGRAAHLHPGMPLADQVTRGIHGARQRYGAEGFIAYFQTGTATYAPLETLRERVECVLAAAPFPILVFATRPDCLPAPVLDWLAHLREHYDVWVELGVQTCHDATLRRLHRGHDTACSFAAAEALRERGIDVAAHVILGLPGEGLEDFAQTARQLRQGAFNGIKIHNLHVVRGSALERLWRRGEIETLDEHAYGEALMAFLRDIPAHWPVMRLAADTPSDRLLAPRWTMGKREFRQYIVTQMQRRGWRQGDQAGDAVPAAPVPAIAFPQNRTQSPSGPAAPQPPAASALMALLQAAPPQLADPTRGAVVLAFGFGEGPLALDSIGSLPGRLAPRVTLHGFAANPKPLTRRRLQYRSLDGCLTALELSGHCRRPWGRIAVHWGDPRRSVVRVAGSADLVLLEPDQPESVPALYTLDFLRRVVRLMAPGAALLCASPSPRLRGALLRLGLTVGHVRSPALPQGGTVAAWQPQTVRVPLPDSERRLACASAAGIPYRDRGLNWTRTRILQYHGRLVDRVRRRVHPASLTAESPPQPATGPPLEDAPR